MFRFTAILLAFVALLQLPLEGQEFTSSNIYVFDLVRPNDSIFEFKNPTYLTDFNKDGYNNHPWFFDNNVIYMSSQLPNQNQPELIKMDLSNKTKARVTATSEGEYSAMPVPEAFRFNFSAVRLEPKGADTLIRLWQFPIDRTTNGRPVFKYINNIGYYCWINSQQVAAFLVDSPSKLAIGDVRTDNFQQIDENVGRCFRMLPNGNLVYVRKQPYGIWQMIEYNVYKKQKEIITNTLPNVEDFGVLRDGTLIMGQDSKLYKFNRITDTEWVEVADFRFYDIKGISRIAVSEGGRIAIVAQ